MVGQYKITTGMNTKWLVKTEQDHNWKEHKVVGQDRTRSQLEGAQSSWSIQNKITTGMNTKWLVNTEQDHNWKEHKVVGQYRTRSRLE